MNGYTWELYNLKDDPTQTNDLAAKEPERLRTMQQLWLVEAVRNHVLPLNNSQVPILTAERPGPATGRTQFVYTAPQTSTQFGAAPSILNRSYRITAEIEVPAGGANGILVTQGGRFGGYGLYLKDGKPTFTLNLLDLERVKWEGPVALAPGRHTIVFDWKMDPQKAAGLSHIVNLNGETRIEKGTALEGLTGALEARGHTVRASPLASGTQAILARDGRLWGGADPRREGVAIGD